MAAKKKGGFWRGVFIFLIGVTCGTGGIAAVAVYVNGLHLPFIKDERKQHLPALSSEREQGRREAVEFQEILRQQQPLPAVESDTPADGDAPARRFDYFLQIGAFTNQNTAEDLHGRMLLDGYNTIINAGTLADGSALYRVWVGPFESENTAEQQRAQLALSGYADVQLLQTAR